MPPSTGRGGRREQFATSTDDECLVGCGNPADAADFVIVRPDGDHLRQGDQHQVRKSGVNAFYCSAYQQIYFKQPASASVPIVAEDKWAADVVMAHDSARHPGRTGLLISRSRLGPEHREQARVEPDAAAGWKPGRLLSRAVHRSVTQRWHPAADLEASRHLAAVGDDTLTGNPAWTATTASPQPGVLGQRQLQQQSDQRLQHLQRPRPAGA